MVFDTFDDAGSVERLDSVNDPANNCALLSNVAGRCETPVVDLKLDANAFSLASATFCEARLKQQSQARFGVSSIVHFFLEQSSQT